MYKIVTLHDKNVRIELSKAAQNAVKLLTEPLLAEIHLIFGCMVVKRVWFKERTHAEAAVVAGNLNVSFSTVRYSKQCRISHIDSGVEEPSDFPLAVEKKAFVPSWLHIDYKKGKWVGTYGYDNKLARELSLMQQSKPVLLGKP